MKLKVGKFMKDRKESTERSKRGELEVLNTDIFRGRIDMLYNDTHPLAEIANCCEHKLTLGCDLPLRKRVKPECECCLWIFKGEVDMDDKEKEMYLSFEPAEERILKDIAKKSMGLIMRDTRKMNLGDSIKDVLAYYTIINIQKDSVEATMKELGIKNLELVKKEEK